tara:strand:+ start:221 stop:550 length:330 start_codon:yes stop_codon:yes gene_type:complete
MRPITPELLAGGARKRLWPLSRKSYPKQFSNIIGTNSLFQESVSFDLLRSNFFEKHITVTNSDFRFIVSEQLQKIGIDPGPILIEPELNFYDVREVNKRTLQVYLKALR